LGFGIGCIEDLEWFSEDFVHVFGLIWIKLGLSKGFSYKRQKVLAKRPLKNVVDKEGICPTSLELGLLFFSLKK
jgi:hypothetical protein